LLDLPGSAAVGRSVRFTVLGIQRASNVPWEVVG